MRGQITVNKDDPRFFQLVRFRGACCAADAQPLPILCISKESLASVKRDAWVEVRGKVKYDPIPGSSPPSYHLRLLVAGADSVRPCPPDPNPYIRDRDVLRTPAWRFARLELAATPNSKPGLY